MSGATLCAGWWQIDKQTNKQTSKIYKDTKGHRVYLQDEETAWRESVLRRQTLTDMTCSGSFFVYKICYIRCVAGWWPDKQSNTNRHRTAPSKNALLEKKTSRPIWRDPFPRPVWFVFFFIVSLVRQTKRKTWSNLWRFGAITNTTTKTRWL